MRIALTALTLLILPAAGWAQTSQPASPEVLPLDAQGLRAELEARRGKVVVLNMWATWCGPCVEEFPHLVAFARSVDPDRVAILAVSSDFPEDLSTAVQPFVNRMAPPFPVYLQSDHEDVFFPAVDPEWSGVFPHTVIFDPEGNIAARLGVFHDTRPLEEAVSQALASASE